MQNNKCTIITFLRAFPPPMPGGGWYDSISRSYLCLSSAALSSHGFLSSSFKAFHLVDASLVNSVTCKQSLNCKHTQAPRYYVSKVTDTAHCNQCCFTYSH